MNKKLTIKQRKFTKNLVKTGSATKAAISAGYSEKTARQIASENLTKPNIQRAIQEIMQDMGLSDDVLLQVLAEGLKSTKQGEGEDIPDFAIRHRFLETAFKLKGAFAAEKYEVNQPVAIIIRADRDY